MRTDTTTWAAGTIGRALLLAAAVAALCAPAAFGHGEASNLYEATIDSIEPKGMPIDVRVENEDQLRVENVGAGELMICGYDTKGCEPYVRIDERGVDVNHNTRSYYANLDTEQYGEVPDDVGTGGDKWVHLRDRPKFFRYHDHRIHWMGGKRLPPGVDSSDPKEQLVNGFDIKLEYDGTPVTITGRLNYVGGQTWIQRYGEMLITGAAILAMLVVFAFDARRRRRVRLAAAGGDSDTGGDEPKPKGPPTETVLLPEHEQKERV